MTGKEMNQLLKKYRNGNYNVEIYADGTKIRETDGNETRFLPDFPESMDLKITNMCDMGCPFCHEASVKDGKHGTIENLSKFINTIRPYTEVAIGGGNPLEHPQLEEMLQMFKDRNIIANMTVNQHHFLRELDRIDKLVNDNLIKGIGISLSSYDEETADIIAGYDNAAIHLINGLFRYKDLMPLFDKNLKVLILGYKELRRGKDYIDDNVRKNKENTRKMLFPLMGEFKVVSFDNLAIKQLDVQRFMTEEQWKVFYMGDDGQYTMYIDLPNNTFAKSSTSDKIYEIKGDIDYMFDIVRKEK